MSRTFTPTWSSPTATRQRPPELAPPAARVLGVDPGSRTTGWGLVAGTSSRPVLIEGGVIRLASMPVLAERLARLRHDLAAVVERLGPTRAAVESPFMGKNIRSVLQLAHARGVILAVLAEAGLSVAEYAPATVKKSVTGSGRAPKDQVRRMVAILLRESWAGAAQMDLTDALAVALCDAASGGHRNRLEQALERKRHPRSGVRP